MGRLTENLDAITNKIRQSFEAKDAAREKVLGYASLLKETGLTYEAMGRAQLATGCFQLALQAMLSVAAEDAVRSEELRERMSELLAKIPPDELHEPVKEALRSLT